MISGSGLEMKCFLDSIQKEYMLTFEAPTFHQPAQVDQHYHFPKCKCSCVRNVALFRPNNSFVCRNKYYIFNSSVSRLIRTRGLRDWYWIVDVKLKREMLRLSIQRSTDCRMCLKVTSYTIKGEVTGYGS